MAKLILPSLDQRTITARLPFYHLVLMLHSPHWLVMIILKLIIVCNFDKYADVKHPRDLQIRNKPYQLHRI